MKKQVAVAALLIFLIVAAVGSYIGAYAYSASKVEIRDVRVTEFTDITLEGAQLNGVVELYNGGIVSVSIERIDYRLVLEGKNLELVSGTIVGGDIPAGQSVNYGVSNRVSWAPTAELALQLLTSEKATAKLEGNVLLKKTWLVDIAVPFEREIPLDNYLNQFIKQQMGENTPQNLIQQAGQLLNQLGII